MKSVAEHATLELSSELNSQVHYTLSYLESQDQQVGGKSGHFSYY